MRVMVIEDDRKVASFIQTGLQQEGYAVDVLHEGSGAGEQARTVDYDAVVLDLMLPGRSGFQVLRDIRSRKAELPVLILTAKNSLDERVAGLDAGADDYMAKPFRFAELMARIRLRLRALAPPDAPVSGDDLVVGSLRLDRRTRRISGPQGESELSAREFALAEILLLNPGQVLTREQLLDLVWGYDFDPGSNVVDVYVGYLRKKLGTDAISTVRGVGYRLNP